MSAEGRPPPRRIKRLLITNRGEIAARILASALELDLETYVLCTPDDRTHTYGAHQAILLKSPAGYMDIAGLIDLVKEHGIDAVHPGYGFLSESADFAKRLWYEANCMVIGPGWNILERTGDKLAARKLAGSMNVPVLPALTAPTADSADIRKFGDEAGFPIMIKAVDGGGGRGIRLVRRPEDLDSAVVRAVEESASRKVFAEKAAADGSAHVEVQIIGDGKNVVHAFERQCSIQRRYQKLIEIAPWTNTDRRFIEKIIESAVKMAKAVNYFSLGTFEFLANSGTQEYFFLEVNPRLQVEHTVTESICSIDIVRTQLLLAQGADCSSAGIQNVSLTQDRSPSMQSMQLRITAEDVQNNWSLSIGKITAIRWPKGNGIRIDTALEAGQSIGSDFDSLLAKIIITARDWPSLVAKARRALLETRIEGVKTNLVVLRGILGHSEFESNKYDTQWLESRSKEIVELGQKIESLVSNRVQPAISQSSISTTSSSSGTLFRRGDAWSIDLKPIKSKSTAEQSSTNHLQLTKVYRNDFPNALSAELTFTSATSSQAFKIEISSTSASGSAVTSQHRRGHVTNPLHVIIPFSGKLVEVCVDEGDEVKKDDVICVVQQMKMEVEVRAKRAGRIVWITEVADGEEVVEGTLAAELANDGPKL